MKLSQIIKSNNWPGIKTTLLKHFPNAKENLERYEFVFEKLNYLPPFESTNSISLSNEKYDDGIEGTIAYKEISLKERSSYFNSLFFPLFYTPWREWLGMEIDQSTYEKYSELEIIVHCLLNMTCISFNEEEILAKKQKFDKQLKEYTEMTREELINHIEIYDPGQMQKETDPDMEEENG